MRIERYQPKFYRFYNDFKDLRQARIVAKETDVQILSGKTLEKDFAEEKLRAYSWEIENYITRDNRFLTALKPLPVELNAPLIIKEMAEQTKKVNVGPMSAVAGSVAEFLGRDLLKKGYKEVVVENANVLFIKTRKIRKIGVYAGRSKIWHNLGLKIYPKNTPLGIGACSGTMGESMSFGCADSVIVISKSAALADAVARAACNQVQSKQDLQPALAFTKSIRGVLGAAVILKTELVTWGEIEFSSK